MPFVTGQSRLRGSGTDHAEVFIDESNRLVFVVINGAPLLGVGYIQLEESARGSGPRQYRGFEHVQVDTFMQNMERTLSFNLQNPQVSIRQVTPVEFEEVRAGYGASPMPEWQERPEPPEDGDVSDRDMRQAIMQVLTGNPALLESFQAELELNEGIAADFTELCENVDRVVQALFGRRLTPQMLRNAWEGVRGPYR